MKKELLTIISTLIWMVSILSVHAQTDDQELEVSITQPENIAGEYDWSGTSGFGGMFESNFCGNIIWAGMEETLGCDSITTDLTDQIVMIRRGTCDFSVKILNAQRAGAKAVVIVNHDQDAEIGLDGTRGMGGGTSADLVTLPAIMLSYNAGNLIKDALAGGEVVELCFKLASFFDPIGPYSYLTPLSQSVPLDNIQISVINRTEEDQTAIETKVEILEPSGSIVELVSVNDFPADGQEVIVTFDTYLPSELGKYVITYFNGTNDEVVTKEFEITEHTWGTDRGDIIGSRGASNEEFTATDDLFQQFGSLVIPGTDGIATHMSFGLGNPAELVSGDASSDLILLAIYDGDLNDDGIIDLNNTSNFEALGNPLEFGLYQITGQETPNELITVELDSPLMLEAGETYFATVAYSGLDAAIGVAPQFSVGSNVEYNRILATPLQYNGTIFSGWDGSSTFIARLHTEGFVVSTEDVQPLASEKLIIFSNPVHNGLLSFELSLDQASDNVHITLRDLQGRLVKHIQRSNVQQVTESIKTNQLTAGTYLLNVSTDEGFRSEKIIIAE